jgi:Flp pilus assembly protein TadG
VVDLKRWISPAMSVPETPISACRAWLAGSVAKNLFCRRFCRSESGGAAVDFALVMLPFLAVLMAIIESAIVLFAGQVLQTATTNSARQIMTGQAQTAGLSAAQFKTSVCASLTVMFNCSNLYIDVESFPSFSSVSLASPTNANGTLNSGNFGYSPGNPGDVVVVRLFYQWPIFAAGLSFGLVNSANNTNTLIATAAFRNEPYSTSP